MCQCNDKQNPGFQSKVPVVYFLDFIINYYFQVFRVSKPIPELLFCLAVSFIRISRAAADPDFMV